MMAAKTNMVVIYSNTNTEGKRDATGAFIPEAKAFQKRHNIPDEHMFGVKCPGVAKAKRRQAALEGIRAVGRTGKIDTIAFFGHGWPKGIQFGFNRNNLIELVNTMAEICQDDVNVILYACLAAENDERDTDYGNPGPATDGGFADMLRDEMVRQGMKSGWVDAHKTAGHTTWNPYVIRFLCSDVEDEEEGAMGGAWIVEPRSQFWKKWRTALKSAEGTLRYDFPFLSELEIKQQLQAL